MTPGTGRARTARLLLAGAGAVALCLTLTPAAGASGRNEISTQDRCDPATFNAVLGPGACVAQGRGTVTFPKFLDKLNAADGGHGAWRFSREDTHIDRGTSLHVANTGGETHSFTEVVSFGAATLPGTEPLNAALPAGTPAVVPAPGDPHFLGPGASVDIAALAPGTHRFQCLIHPWMRSVVEVR